MTIFINDSRAGGSAPRIQASRVPAAAVWEPSGYLEGSAEQRGVRTLQPADRTQRRISDPVLASSNATWRERSRRRRDTWMTYLVGALFGSALIGAALVGEASDPASAPYSATHVPVVEAR